MRELKFRMVTQTTGKLLGYVDIYDLLRNGSDVLPDFEEAILEGVKFEQYTGLKDKNGKEIYEGDIVEKCFNKAKKLYSSAPVEFNHGRFVSGGWYLWKIAHKCEVIGNIHENPESFGGEE